MGWTSGCAAGADAPEDGPWPLSEESGAAFISDPELWPASAAEPPLPLAPVPALAFAPAFDPEPAPVFEPVPPPQPLIRLIPVAAISRMISAVVSLALNDGIIICLLFQRKATPEGAELK